MNGKYTLISPPIRPQSSHLSNTSSNVRQEATGTPQVRFAAWYLGLQATLRVGSWVGILNPGSTTAGELKLADGTGVGSDSSANSTVVLTHPRRSGTITTRYEFRASLPRAESGPQLSQRSCRHTCQRLP
jgi:hypothetical protein